MMDNGQQKRVRLKGGPEHTASSVEIRDDGSLVVEFYDYSDQAERCFGNDVAYMLFVDAREAAMMLPLLSNEQADAEHPKDPRALLLQLLSHHFDNYFELKDWLETNEISFRKEFDSRA